MCPGRVKTRTTGRQFMNFSRFSAVFGHYSLGAAQKFAPGAPFSDSFRVLTQSGSKRVGRDDRSRLGTIRPSTVAAPVVSAADACIVIVKGDEYDRYHARSSRG